MKIRKLTCALPLLAVIAIGCTPTANDSRSAVILTAAFGGGDTDTVGFFSDVVSNTLDTSDDFYEVGVRSIAKSPDAILSDLYRVNFFAYQVSFTRPDGRNEPGVDVPFPFTTAVGGTVGPGDEATLNLLFVTKEMKLEPPLRNLWFGDGERIFSTMNFTIFGTDLVENAVSASATTVVIFEDLAG